MKIISIADFAADSLIGGAEHNLALVLDELRAMDHEVEDLGMRRIDGGIGVDMPDPSSLDADRFLVGNWTHLDPRWLLILLREQPGKVVAWVHDRPWCIHRTGACHGQVQPRHNCRVALYWTLLQSAHRTLFYSPSQMAAAAQFFGPSDRYALLPIFCSRAKAFYDCRQYVREPGSVVFLGRLSEGKGAVCLALFAGANKGRYSSIRAYGRPQNAEMGAMLTDSGVEICDPVPNEEVPALLGRAEWFYHQPPTPDACPRTVTEARLAGCKLIVGANAGNLTHPDWVKTDEELVACAMGAPRYTAEAVLA